MARRRACRHRGGGLRPRRQAALALLKALPSSSPHRWRSSERSRVVSFFPRAGSGPQPGAWITAPTENRQHGPDPQSRQRTLPTASTSTTASSRGQRPRATGTVACPPLTKSRHRQPAFGGRRRSGADRHALDDRRGPIAAERGCALRGRPPRGGRAEPPPFMSLHRGVRSRLGDEDVFEYGENAAPRLGLVGHDLDGHTKLGLFAPRQAGARRR